MPHLIRRLRLSLLNKLLAGKCSVPDTIVITSSPRSGSTWLGQILSAIPGSAGLFEPLHLNYVTEAKDAGFGWRTYRAPEADWPEGREFLQKVFDGRMLNWWTTQEMSIRTAMSAKFLVVKFVRASRLLPWICKQFPLRAPILLVRHPCAVVSSQLRSDNDWQKPNRPDVQPFLDSRPDLKELISNLETREEFLAANWALDYVPALMAPSPRPWQMVSYEELVTQTKPAVERIFSAWNMPIPDGVWAKVNAPSKMTWSSGISGLDGWKKNLKEDEIRRILDVVARFGLSFYGDSPEPDYTRLHQPDLMLAAPAVRAA